MGGTGFIGSHLVDALAAGDDSVRVLSRGLAVPTERHVSTRVEHFKGDFCEPASMEKAVRGCDIIYHLAATTLPKSSNERPSFDVNTNVLGSLALLDLASRCAVKKIVFISSGGTVYGQPDTIPIPETFAPQPLCSYGITKLTIERYLDLYWKVHGLDYRVLRVSNAFGERQRPDKGQGAVAVLLDRALTGKSLEVWGDGSVIRDYVHIHDVVRALLLAARHDGDEKLFNIGTGRGTSLNELIDIVERVCGRQIEHVHLPGRPFDVARNVLDIAKARAHLGWSPEVSLIDGVRRTMDWMTAQRLRGIAPFSG